MKQIKITGQGLAFSIALAFVPGLANAQERYVDVWFRSFIGTKHPKLPSYITQAKNNLYVLKAPNFPIPKMIDIGRLSGTCFTTDQRDFSNALDASSRVGVYLRISIKNREVKVGKIDEKPNVVIGATHNVDCITGADLVPPLYADPEGTTITDVKNINFLRNFSVRISASDPYYKMLGHSVAPNISSEILFSYDTSTRKLKVKGSLEDFPWFEGYYRKSTNGKIVKIINSQPDKESGVMSLVDLGIGINTRNFEETIDLLK